MIQATQETALALVSNTDAITFDNIDLRTSSANCGCNGWLQYTQGSSQFQIIKGGIYEIQFNSNITSETSGIVGISIETNGQPLAGTQMDETIATTGEYTNISATKRIRVCNNASTIITVASIPSINSVATQIPTIKNANIIIKKVC